MPPLNLDCPECNGTGKDPTDRYDSEECRHCDGTGELLPPEDDDAYDRKGNR